MELDLKIALIIFASASVGALASLVAILKFSFIGTIKGDNKRLREELEDIKKRLSVVEAERDKAKQYSLLIKHKLRMIASMYPDLPIPEWLSDVDAEIENNVDGTYIKQLVKNNRLKKALVEIEEFGDSEQKMKSIGFQR